MNLLGLFEPYPWGTEWVGATGPHLSVHPPCSRCGNQFPTHLSYLIDGHTVPAPCLLDYCEGDQVRADKIHAAAMTLRSLDPDLIAPSSILGPEADRVISFVVDGLGESGAPLTPEQEGWVLLCRFPTIRSAHAPYLLDAWGAWLSHKDPEETQALAGNHLGEVGERLELHVKVSRITGPFEGEFGDSYLCVMETQLPSTPGELLSWWTGENLYFDEGKEYHVRGTVKKHDEYGGRKQTQLTRVKEVK